MTIIPAKRLQKTDLSNALPLTVSNLEINDNDASCSLIGRANQLEILDQQYSLIEQNAFCISLLSGERGVGKTALVRQLVHRYRLDPLIYIEVELNDQNNQTDHFIQTILSEIISRLFKQSKNSSSAGIVLEKLLTLFNDEGVEWLFNHLIPENHPLTQIPQNVQQQPTDNVPTDKKKQIPEFIKENSLANAETSLEHRPLQHTQTDDMHRAIPAGAPRKIIRRDAFIALLKHVLTESSILLSSSSSHSCSF